MATATIDLGSVAAEYKVADIGLAEFGRKEIDIAKRLKNDDVTLMRLRIAADQPSFLLACR